VHFEARRGIIEAFSVDGVDITSSSLIGASVHDIDDWTARLSHSDARLDAPLVGAWLNDVLGTRFTIEESQD
jgi:hypothetical protein